MASIVFTQVDFLLWLPVFIILCFDHTIPKILLAERATVDFLIGFYQEKSKLFIFVAACITLSPHRKATISLPDLTKIGLICVFLPDLSSLLVILLLK